MIHRHSEWIMLNLGESIFSLLIIYVPDEGNDFYTTFYCSLLTVMLLHVLHFKSQPMHADHHAWRRSKNAGFLFFVLTHMYTLGLVSLGAAYTFFLLEANNNNNASDEKHRYLMMQQQQHITYYDEGNDLHRWLADTETNVDSEKYEHQIARLFCITLALIFASLDLMTLSHLGFEECEQRCYHKCPHTKAKKLYNIKGYVLIFFRIAIIFFTATMDLWERNVKNLSIAGLLLVFAQIMLRVLGAIYLGKHKKHQVHVAAEE